MPNVIDGAAVVYGPSAHAPASLRDAVEMDDDEIARPLAVDRHDSVGKCGNQCGLVAGETCVRHARRQVWHSQDLCLLPKRF